jgi:hypothetical protein
LELSIEPKWLKISGGGGGCREDSTG